MQRLTNATSTNQGINVQLSADSTWSYPFLPGEPSSNGSQNLLRQRFAACVPSNITIASACCARANGTFVLNTISANNTRQLTNAEITSILNAKYPSRNNANPGIGGAPSTNGTYTIANLTTAANATSSSGGINWCSLPYAPVTSTPLPNNATGYQSGPTTGNYPQSVLDWTACFHSYVSPADFSAGRAAYVCATDDVREGGTIPGYAQYTATKSGAHERMGQGGQGMVLLVAMVASGALYILGLGM